MYCFSTTFGGAVSGAAERKKFRKRKRIILSQAQNGLKFINAIAGAGFDIGTDVGKKLSMMQVLKLTGDLVLTFGETQGTFAKLCVSSYNLVKDANEARKKIGSLIENPALFPHMTVKENLTYYAKLKNASEQKVDELLDLVGLQSSAMHKKTANLSLGMKQRLSIAIAMLNDPEFLVLDEPINGLDPEGIVEVRRLLVKLNQERGITILISSHILGEMEKMATRYGIIRDGKLIKKFDAEKLNNTSSGKMVIETDDYERACRILAENGIKVTRSHEEREDIESFFIGLVEG